MRICKLTTFTSIYEAINARECWQIPIASINRINQQTEYRPADQHTDQQQESTLAKNFTNTESLCAFDYLYQRNVIALLCIRHGICDPVKPHWPRNLARRDEIKDVYEAFHLSFIKWESGSDSCSRLWWALNLATIPYRFQWDLASSRWRMRSGERPLPREMNYVHNLPDLKMELELRKHGGPRWTRKWGWMEVTYVRWGVSFCRISCVMVSSLWVIYRLQVQRCRLQVAVYSLQVAGYTWRRCMYHEAAYD